MNRERNVKLENPLKIESAALLKSTAYAANEVVEKYLNPKAISKA